MNTVGHTRTLIVVGITAIALTVAITVGWNVMFTKYYFLHEQTRFVSELRAGYWLLLSLGDVFLVLVLAALVILLVTHLRKERLLQQQNTFIDRMTHELKSPLASLQLALDTLELRNPSPELRARFIGMMKEDVRRLTGFVESILEAGRLAHETEPLALEQVDVRALVAECIQRIRRQHALPSTAIDFVEQQLAQNPVYTDPRALETIVINLLDNAVKYSFDRIAITVTLTATEDWLRLAIHDQGVGIPPGRTRRIFERFYRLAENARRVRGTGLGLYIALALARRLGGAIEVHSAGAGFGSTFTVSLPTMVADIPRALPSPEEVSLEQQAPTRRG